MLANSLQNNITNNSVQQFDKFLTVDFLVSKNKNVPIIGVKND